MVSAASGGNAERIAARIWFKVVHAGSGTPARYSSIFFGAARRFAAVLRWGGVAFFVRVMLRDFPPQRTRLGLDGIFNRLLHSFFDDTFHGVLHTSIFERLVACFGHRLLDGLFDGRCDGMKFFYQDFDDLI